MEYNVPYHSVKLYKGVGFMEKIWSCFEKPNLLLLYKRQLSTELKTVTKRIDDLEPL